jgi:hypothetical protein
MIDEIAMIAKIRARHVHYSILPEIITNTHRHENERGFSPAATGGDMLHRSVCRDNHNRCVCELTGLGQGRKWGWRRWRLLTTGDEHH